MTGNPNPDNTGDYLPDGIYNGKMSYRRLDGAFFIWWDIPNTWWRITTAKGVWAEPHFFKVDPITGTYAGMMGATGVAVVTEI